MRSTYEKNMARIPTIPPKSSSQLRSDKEALVEKRRKHLRQQRLSVLPPVPISSSAFNLILEKHRVDLCAETCLNILEPLEPTKTPKSPRRNPTELGICLTARGFLKLLAYQTYMRKQEELLDPQILDYETPRKRHSRKMRDEMMQGLRTCEMEERATWQIATELAQEDNVEASNYRALEPEDALTMWLVPTFESSVYHMPGIKIHILPQYFTKNLNESNGSTCIPIRAIQPCRHEKSIWAWDIFCQQALEGKVVKCELVDGTGYTFCQDVKLRPTHFNAGTPKSPILDTLGKIKRKLTKKAKSDGTTEVRLCLISKDEEARVELWSGGGDLETDSERRSSVVTWRSAESGVSELGLG